MFLFLLTNKIIIHKLYCNYNIVNTLSIVTGEYIYLVGLKSLYKKIEVLPKSPLCLLSYNYTVNRSIKDLFW